MSASQANYALDLYQKLHNKPLGNWLFSKVLAAKAPYFKTINARITHLVPDHCECVIRKCRKVENHIGTVHAIAICNGLELAMGVMAEASIPAHLRWIPKGMSIDYIAKANSDIRCVATVATNAWQLGNMSVQVVAFDRNNIEVVKGQITLWISAKNR